jgi:hypothetical protein
MKVKVFEYTFFFRILFRFGNIPVTIILSVYLVPIIINLDKDLIYIIPLIIILGLIYLVNKHYLRLYQIMPYKITANDEKLICEEFLFNKKQVEVFYKDIESLSGGLFEGKLRGLMKVWDSKSKICIGFYDKIREIKELQTILLSRVNEDVYNRVIENVGLKKNK